MELKSSFNAESQATANSNVMINIRGDGWPFTITDQTKISFGNLLTYAQREFALLWLEAVEGDDHSRSLVM